ncbi:pseudaminic acid cytidylyltransferase [Sphingomonas sp. CJ20]
MTLAVIPARGGSKRIPRKNVRAFAGQPMIAHAIRVALACPEIARVVVSTDDDEIADIARSCGAQVPFRRPDALADDHSPTVPVVAHAITACRALGWGADAVCCIYPAVPLLRPEDLSAGHALLRRRTAPGYAFPVVAFPSPVERALRRAADGQAVPVDPRHAETRTQDLEPAYYDAGQFYWGHAEAWLAELPVHPNAHVMPLPEDCAIDIDTPEDWTRAERLYAVMRA